MHRKHGKHTHSMKGSPEVWKEPSVRPPRPEPKLESTLPEYSVEEVPLLGADSDVPSRLPV